MEGEALGDIGISLIGFWLDDTILTHDGQVQDVELQEEPGA